MSVSPSVVFAFARGIAPLIELERDRPYPGTEYLRMFEDPLLQIGPLPQARIGEGDRRCRDRFRALDREKQFVHG